MDMLIAEAEVQNIGEQQGELHMPGMFGAVDEPVERNVDDRNQNVPQPHDLPAGREDDEDDLGDEDDEDDGDEDEDLEVCRIVDLFRFMVSYLL